MSANAWIIDGYVDEPACLGVPPYISPYIRTVAGVLAERKYRTRYCTIDQVRSDPVFFSRFSKSALVVMIAGVTVPGKYIGGTPATLTEIQQIGLSVRGPEKFIGGPIGFGYSPGGGEKAVLQAIAGFDHLLKGSPAEALDSWFGSGAAEGRTDYPMSDVWSVAGSPIIREHPSFPFLMCEIETARGCARVETGGCSFCTEPLYGPPVYRSPGGIVREVEALYSAGARHFRIGRQPDLLSYMTRGGEFPVPEATILEDLFSGIKNAAPGLETLHIDNVNPGTIARHPDESREALEVIVKYHTPGDVAAFGMETADPVVVRENNLKAGPEEVMAAIRIVNDVGARRNQGIPELLPGLNFVTGLKGETVETYELNESFLMELLGEDLLVRRVNLRQLMAFPGTRAFIDNTLGIYDSRFRKFKEFVRNNFDRPMIRRVFPIGTVFRHIIIEISGSISFGRQMGTYPVLVGIPLVIPCRTVIDAAVVDYGSRSLTALPVPLDINHLPHSALKWLPGVGKGKAGAIAAGRPYRSLEEFRKVAGTGPLDNHMIFLCDRS
ncbi:MAG TPA: radical SAM protein [Methanoregulaceae archaeon]|nr:radical SAM protein [Methanoregulaceae archaeon]